MLNSIHSGNLSCKPGWVRLSTYPAITNEEVSYIMDAIEETAVHANEWQKDYQYNAVTN